MKRKWLIMIALVVCAVGAGFYIQFGLLAASTASIIVVGAGPSGVAASIQAARMGQRVVLLEETDWIGGQLTAAGVGTLDEGSTAGRQSGIYKELIQKARQFYASHNKSLGTCYYDTNALCIDPKDGQAILRDMLQSVGVKVVLDTKIASVIKHDSRITGAVTDDGKTYTAKIVIDASEYGDTIAKSGAVYRIGASTSEQKNKKDCVQQITYPAIIKKYPQGVRSELQVKTKPEGYDDARAHFAAIVTSDGADYFKQQRHPVDFASFTAYRGLPDISNPKNYTAKQNDGRDITRTTINSPNDYPIKLPLGIDYIENPAYRAKTNCLAKLLTVQFIYYLQHDLGKKDWSVADDEGYDTPYNRAHHCPQLDGYEAIERNMPQEPYVRESRRIIGVETLTSDDMQRPRSAKDFANSIAVGYYPMDLHGCSAPDDLESDLDPPQNAIKTSTQSTFLGGGAGPFEVPIGALIPRDINGLLAAEKNISVSRLAGGAIRLQPIAMNVGQAAGALAAIAVKKDIAPRNVSAQDVRAALQQAGAIVDMPQ